MIIDMHAHCGVVENGHKMPIENQLYGMEKYGIDYAIISNVECGECHDCIEGNKRALEIVKQYRDKFSCMLWATEDLTEEEKNQFEELYLQNKDLIKGLKVHPDISKTAVDSPCFDYVYRMAEKYDLPVLLHTNNTEFSSIEKSVNAAKKYPKARFILGHMDISSDDCIEALNAVRDYDNIYGDTCWIWLDAVKKANEMGIIHKMMFGTDSPISGKDTYMDVYYKDYYTFDADYMRDVMCENARKFFKF